jgi:hypothetical protein
MGTLRRARRPALVWGALATALAAPGCAKVLGFDATLPEADGGSVPWFDGTTGQACARDGDCVGASGPGVNRCDLSSPAPACRLPQCAAHADGHVHYCDGPDVPASPGICLADGTCWPKCTFGDDGTPAVGCLGQDACNAYAFETDPATGTPRGIGYCRGGCETDVDCRSGMRCQTDRGLCVATLSFDEALGTACQIDASPACDCFYAATSHAGYCAQACTMSGAECPPGSTCEALLPTTYVAGDATVQGFTTQSPGLGGLCAPTCGPGLPICPAGSTCQLVTVAGPDCLP